MKLVSKRAIIDKASFQPHIRLTVEIPIEPMIDDRALKGAHAEEWAPILGKQLMEYALADDRKPAIEIYGVSVFDDETEEELENQVWFQEDIDAYHHLEKLKQKYEGKEITIIRETKVVL